MSASFSAGFLMAEQQNTIYANSCQFREFQSQADGGLFYLDISNVVSLNLCIVENGNGLNGGIFATADFNNVSINYCNFTNITSTSIG